MFNIGEIKSSICISNDLLGNGICKIDDFTFFIPKILKDEEIEFEITKLNKSYGEGKLLRTIKESKNRIIPICPHYDLCGGCNLMHLNYINHSDYKKDALISLINRIGKVNPPINDCIMMDDYMEYRNNVQVSFSYKNNKIIAGFFKENSHEVSEIDNCIMIPKIANDIINYLKELFTTYNIKPFDYKLNKGIIKHVMIRTNYLSEMMVVLISNTNIIPHLDIIVKDLTTKFSNIISIIHNINNSNTSIHLGNISKVIYGKKYITDRLFDLDFEIDAHSFFQVNRNQVIKLYSKVFEYAKLNKNDVVIDAYCGIGTMTLLASKKCKYVYGIEVVKEAIINANRNKEINKIENVEFILGKAEDKINELITREKIDCLIVDPPRKGCDESFLKSILGIKKIIYVSCGPSTLARDLYYLTNHGYEAKEITPCDMFPFSSHVECVALLQLKEPKNDKPTK